MRRDHRGGNGRRQPQPAGKPVRSDQRNVGVAHPSTTAGDVYLWFNGENEAGEPMTEPILFPVVLLGAFPATRLRGREGRGSLEDLLAGKQRLDLTIDFTGV